MKIPLDFFLRLLENFLDELELSDISKKLKKYYETPEEDYKDILSEVSLKNIISNYVKENKDLKKKLKKKIKQIENSLNEKEESEEKLTTKKRKRTLSNDKEEKEKPKRKRTLSNDKEEKPKRKRTLSNDKEEKPKRKRTLSNDKEEKSKKKKKKQDDESINLEEEVKFIPKPKSNDNPDRIPFKRVDESKTKKQVPEKFRDNSYAAFMKQTGDDFGKAANDKLIVTRGKGFRKEKTKFKNKTFHGGMNISTTIRSTKLEDASSDDD